VIFYGEQLVSRKNPFWGLFSAIERLGFNAADFCFLPGHKVHWSGGEGEYRTGRPYMIPIGLYRNSTEDLP
jgi:hypothetical protein